MAISEQDWQALDVAAQRDTAEGPLAERLEILQQAIDTERVRQVGSNIVGLSTNDGADILKIAQYSIIDGNPEIVGHAVISYSFINALSMINESYIRESIIKDSLFENSEVTKSIIRYSSLSDAVIDESTIQTSAINDSDFEFSTVTGMEIGTHSKSFSKADLSHRTHLMDLGDFIGLGLGVLVYRTNGGGIHIQAGCKSFTSTRQMRAYAHNARDYSHLDEKTRQVYLKQIRAAATLINATVEAWPSKE